MLRFNDMPADRRALLAGSGSLLLLAALPGCQSGKKKTLKGAASCPYEVGTEHLAFGPNGERYEIDTRGHRIVERSGPSPRSLAGELGDDPGQFNHPLDLTVGDGGELLVLDRGNGRLQVLAADGTHRSTFEIDARLPRDVHVHGGRTYVCDTIGHRVLILDEAGNRVGTIDPGDPEVLNGPTSVAVDSAGQLHVADSGSASVRVFSATGDLVGSYGGYGGGPGQLIAPSSIARGPDGRLYVADPRAGLISVFDENGEFVERFEPLDDDGRAVHPMRLTFRPDGVLYVWVGHHPHRG